jgi:hypothetical protein
LATGGAGRVVGSVIIFKFSCWEAAVRCWLFAFSWGNFAPGANVE